MNLLAEIIDAFPIIISLIVIEGLLSVDNALAIASMVSHLPGKQKVLALRLGIFGAYFFRFVAILLASWIINNQWVKAVGAVYLIYLMISHLLAKDEKNPHEAGVSKKSGLWMTVFHVELMDLTLSVDNVVAAVGMSSKLWVVITGVFIGIIILRLFAGYCIKIVERWPILKKTAFVLVGYVGVLLLIDIFAHYHVHSLQKFAGVVLILAVALAYDKLRSRKKA
ncbi:MAG: DUF475 domain-containing protein [bacterium]